MLIEISFGNEKMEFDLIDGVLHVGGAPNDEIRVEGMPKSLLTLNLLGERLMVTASAAVTIGGVQFPAHIPRLVVPGEKMQLPSGVSLKQLKPKDEKHRSFKGTACVLKEMVGSTFSASSSRAATLTCLTGLDAGFSHPIAMNETIVGRGDKCAIRIRDRAVSRLHARVVRQRSSDFLEAFPDTNGLFINGEPVKKATLLRAGDVIELGQSLMRYDGPENALEADEKTEPTVLVSSDELEMVELPPPPPEETAVAEPPVPPRVVEAQKKKAVRPMPAQQDAFNTVVLAAGAALALIGLVVTISAYV